MSMSRVSTLDEADASAELLDSKPPPVPKPLPADALADAEAEALAPPNPFDEALALAFALAEPLAEPLAFALPLADEPGWKRKLVVSFWKGDKVYFWKN